MIVGIGIDVVDIGRFSKSVENWGERFVNRILTAGEITYCRKKVTQVESMAARFAAKEAVFKCFHPNIQKTLRWHDLEIKNDHHGQPQIIFLGKQKDYFKHYKTHLSISHMGNLAIAVVVIETKNTE